MKPECRQFEFQLGDFLEGFLPLPARRDAEAHMAGCRECRTLYCIAAGEVDLLAPEAEQPLLGQILRRTSGAACSRALDRMCDLVDGTIASTDAHILSIHLQNCPPCAETRQTLAEIRAVLPQTARIWPGAGFAYNVLAATTRRRKQAEPGWTRARRWWTGFVHRPRLAWEVAYLATLILLVTIGNPALMSMEAVRGKARTAWTLAVSDVERVSIAGLAAAERTAERVSGSMVRRRAAAQGSLGSLWNQSSKIASTALAADSSLAARYSSRVRAILQDLARTLGLDRTFSQAMRYLEWVR